ncbi:hypothetical protein Bbelb_035290 [Branchiostoma belcheri]|nr:hypothetical protein Bbelb_035290 [Branchiostoma belcheri]
MVYHVPQFLKKYNYINDLSRESVEQVMEYENRDLFAVLNNVDRKRAIMGPNSAQRRANLQGLQDVIVVVFGEYRLIGSRRNLIICPSGTSCIWHQCVASLVPRSLALSPRGEHSLLRNENLRQPTTTYDNMASSNACKPCPPKRKSTSKKRQGDSKARRKLDMGVDPQPVPVEALEPSLLTSTMESNDFIKLLEDIEEEQAMFDITSSCLPGPVAPPSDGGTVGAYGLGPTFDANQLTGVGQQLVRQPVSTSQSVSTSHSVSASQPVPASQPVAVNQTPSADAMKEKNLTPYKGGFYTSTGANSEEVRLPLQDDIFLTVGFFNNRPLISVRHFYTSVTDCTTLRPGKRGLSLTTTQWDALKNSAVYGLPATTTLKPRMFSLGSMRYVVVELVQGQPSIGLYQYEGVGQAAGGSASDGSNLRRTEKGGVTSKYCTGLPPPATTESTEQTEHDLETLQEQHKALVAALEKAKLAKEVRDMEAALQALETSAPPLTTGTLPPSGTPASPLPTHAVLPTSHCSTHLTRLLSI